MLQVGALKAIIQSVPADTPSFLHLRAFEILSTPIAFSTLVAEGSGHIPWISLTDAICKTKGAAQANALADGVIARTRIITWADRESFGMGCPLLELMHPVLYRLRSASLPAASKLEKAFGVELAAAHRDTAWVGVAKIISENNDATLVGPLVDGVIVSVTAAKTPSARSASSPFGSFPCTSQDSTFCPFLDLVHPILRLLLASDLTADAKRLQTSLKTGLTAALAEPVPDMPDYSMRAEAETIGPRHPALREFLLSQQVETTFNASKAGRMEIHRLIDGSIGYGKLTHASQGSGRSRELVVRKVHAERKHAEIGHQRKLQERRRQLLTEV